MLEVLSVIIVLDDRLDSACFQNDVLQRRGCKVILPPELVQTRDAVYCDATFEKDDARQQLYLQLYREERGILQGRQQNGGGELSNDASGQQHDGTKTIMQPQSHLSIQRQCQKALIR